jgi:hypothetical protein
MAPDRKVVTIFAGGDLYEIPVQPCGVWLFVKVGPMTMRPPERWD